MKSFIMLLCVIIFCINCTEPKKNITFYDLQKNKILSQKSSGIELSSILQIRGYNKNNLYLLDFYNSRIVRYNILNNSFHTIGREGKGPGEFQGILSFSFLNDKTLVVYDFIQRKFSFFSEEGIFLKSVNFGEDVKKFEIDSRNNIYIQARNIKVEGKNIKTIYDLAKYNSKLEKIKTIKSVVLVRDILLKDSRPIKMPIGFSPDFIWALNDNGKIITCVSNKKIINIFNDSLKAESFELDNLPKYKVKENDKDEYFASIRQKKYKKYIEFAEFKPIIEEILFIGSDILFKGIKINDNLNEYFVYDQKLNYKYRIELEGDIFSEPNYFIDETIYYSKYSENNGTEIYEGRLKMID